MGAVKILNPSVRGEVSYWMGDYYDKIHQSANSQMGDS